jgi:hypothetical protein
VIGRRHGFLTVDDVVRFIEMRVQTEETDPADRTRLTGKKKLYSWLDWTIH